MNEKEINDSFDEGEFSAKRTSAVGSRAEESMNRTAQSYVANRHISTNNANTGAKGNAQASVPHRSAVPTARPVPKQTAQTPLTRAASPVQHAPNASRSAADTQNQVTRKAPDEKSSERIAAFAGESALDYAGYSRRKPKKSKKLGAKTFLRRALIVIASLLLFAIIAVYSVCFTIAKGPSETVRNLLVLSAKQASATKWVPALFLDKDTVNSILADSEKVSTDIISLDEYMSDDTEDTVADDEWKNAKDGMIYKTIKGSTYTAYMLMVKDPSRVFVGTSSANFAQSTAGATIFDASKKNGAVAAINGGEFPDSGGIGTGEHPIGLTYSKGSCVWSDSLKRTFIGFDRDNKLIVRESMTKKEADELAIRDAVSFQTGNVLISSDGESVTFYYEDGNTGTAQRTAIGQRSDGAVILLVTDGRTASSLGATHNDVIDIMVQYGAINAAMLDGGSSAMMYYEDYYNKYDFDYESLDQYQKKGLINKYKAFTTPRRMPTFFMVASEEGVTGNEN